MTKQVKAVSVSLKEVNSGEKSVLVQDWQQTRAFVPKVAFFGHDKEHRYWIAEWWLKTSSLQFTPKRTRTFEVSAPDEFKTFDWAEDAPSAEERKSPVPTILDRLEKLEKQVLEFQEQLNKRPKKPCN